MKKSRNCTRIEDHNRKGFASTSEPLYKNEDFVYYFESRLKEMVRNEFDAHFRECFYNLPF